MTSFATRKLAAGAALAAFSLMVVLSVAPPPSASHAAVFRAYEKSHAQKLTVSSAIAVSDITRDKYSATPATETYVNRGTNFDWATLVLIDGKWPVTQTNVAVITRWMRQENGPNNWWNRNNPLNNGYGSGGMAGTGTYANLQIAAEKAAENLHTNPGFAPIANAFASGASADVIQHAIFASPWSTSHYANGAHWSMTPVPSFKAPASAW